MKIPFLNLQKEAKFLIEYGIMQDIEKTFATGHYLFGPKSKELEEKFSEMFNSEAILVGNGTEAIYLALRSYGIGPGKKVAIPAFSAIPTATAVKMTGAEIVYIDIVPATGCMNYYMLEEFNDLDAVVIVHLYGNVADVKKTKLYCQENKIPLIEDCAQSFGATINHKKVGTFGNMGAFSMYPTKNLGTAGDSGLVITKDTSLAQTIKELRFYGQKQKYVMGDVCGINSRADEIQSTILLNKLKILPEIEEQRLRMLHKYRIELSNKLQWEAGSMPHLFPIRVKNRRAFIKKMKEKEIDTAIHYPFTLPQAIDKKIEPYLYAESFADEIVSIPFHPWLEPDEVDYILETTKKCLGEIE